MAGSAQVFIVGAMCDNLFADANWSLMLHSVARLCKSQSHVNGMLPFRHAGLWSSRCTDRHSRPVMQTLMSQFQPAQQFLFSQFAVQSTQPCSVSPAGGGAASRS